MRSFVLRLAGSALRAGRVSGQVEAVQTGHVHLVGDAEELIAFLLSTGASGEATQEEGLQPWDSESQWPDDAGGY